MTPSVSPPGFAAILAEQIEGDWPIEVEEIHPHNDSPWTSVAILATPDEVAGSALAAKVPELCPCVRFDGQVPGHMRGSSWAFVPCDHREAPTVGVLLDEAAAARVAKGYPAAAPTPSMPSTPTPPTGEQ